MPAFSRGHALAHHTTEPLPTEYETTTAFPFGSTKCTTCELSVESHLSIPSCEIDPPRVKRVGATALHSAPPIRRSPVTAAALDTKASGSMPAARIEPPCNRKRESASDSSLVGRDTGSATISRTPCPSSGRFFGERSHRSTGYPLCCKNR